LLELRFAEIGSQEIRSLEIDASEIGSSKISSLEIGALEIGIFECRVSKDGTRQVRSTKTSVLCSAVSKLSLMTFAVVEY